MPLTLATMMVVLALSVPTAARCASLGVDKNSEAGFRESRALNGATIAPDAYDQAVQQWRALPSRPATTARMGRPSITMTGVLGTVWTPIGPSPIVEGSNLANGRVSAIAVNPNNPNLIYAGSSGGGVWRTTDGGATWTPLYDQQVTLGVGEPSSIAIDPSNTTTIYVGTSSRFVKNISKGILKSTDGGGSWLVLGDGFPDDNTGNADDLFAGRQVNAIIVDPTNSNVLYLGASNGLYRSIDGGRNWTQGTNGLGDVRSLVLDPTSPAGARRLYAGVSGSGVRQSTDGGQTWTQILSTATPAVSAALPANSTIGQVLVDLAPPTAPPNPGGIQVLYVSMEGRCTVTGCGVADPLGLFRSTDQGATWNLQTSAGIPTNTQGGYSFSMGVDPASPGDGANDIIYLGAVGAAKSTDSGNNFAAVGPGIHVDSHSAWVFALQPSPTPSIVLTGNDGGIWKSIDGGATWSGTGGPEPTINAGGMQTALFYNLDIKNDVTGSVTQGSTQDNGTPRTTGGTSWTDVQGGDGWDIGFDSQTTSNAYNSSGFWSPAPCTRVWKSTNSGSSFPSDVTPWGTTSDQGCYLAPINTDPSMADVVYASGNQNLWQTLDGGSSWRIILNQGRADVKVARANSNNVVAASGTQVFVSTNALAGAGVAFTNITRNLPARSVSRVEFDPNDPTIIYAVLSGFNSQTVLPGHVFRTTIGGSVWTDISPALDVPFNAIVIDGVTIPSTIYVGTDLGVLRSVDGGTSWSTLDDVHLPNVPVTDLVINRQARVLRAATFGRGAFEFAEPADAVIAVNAQDGLQFGAVCDGATKHLTLQVFNVGTQNLVINSIQRLFGSTAFTVLPNPSTPLIISPNAEVDFTVQYTSPTIINPESALIRISSNDPSAPNVDLMATANPSLSPIGPTIALTSMGPSVFNPPDPWATEGLVIGIFDVTAGANLHHLHFSADALQCFSLPCEPGQARKISGEMVEFVPAEIAFLAQGATRQVEMKVAVPIGQHAGTYTGDVHAVAETNDTCEPPSIETAYSIDVQRLVDMDIDDNEANLSNNTMQLIGAKNSVVEGHFKVVNPNATALNVDADDGPGNIRIEPGNVIVSDLVKVGDPAVAIPSSAIQVTGLHSLASGEALSAQLEVTIPDGIPVPAFYVGTVEVEYQSCEGGGLVSDAFNVKLEVRETQGTLAILQPGIEAEYCPPDPWTTTGQVEFEFDIHANGDHRNVRVFSGGFEHETLDTKLDLFNFFPEEFALISAGETKTARVITKIPIGQPAGLYEGWVKIVSESHGEDSIKVSLNICPIYDIDIKDNYANLSDNVMVINGLANANSSGGEWTMKAFDVGLPNELANNHDEFDGPSNTPIDCIECTFGEWSAKWQTPGQDNYETNHLFTGTASVDGEECSWPSGTFKRMLVDVYVPPMTKSDNLPGTYRNTVTCRGLLDGAEVASDQFEVELVLSRVTGPGPVPSATGTAFGGTPTSAGPVLYWGDFSSLGVGGTVNLYRESSGEYVLLKSNLSQNSQLLDTDVRGRAQGSYKLGMVMEGGHEVLLGPIQVGAIPRQAELMQNTPNPFGGMTEIRYSLPSNGRVSLRIYDLAGRLVRTLQNGEEVAGFKSVVWDRLTDSGQRAKSGVYYYRLITREAKLTRRMVIIH